MKTLDILKVETEQTVEVLVGNEVLSLLTDEEFLFEWDQLHHSCPWATMFQGKEFVAAWYKIYYQKHLPIIVKSTQNGRLDGLITLAKFNGKITGAGGKHAEYQTWLSTPQRGEAFIKSTLYKLRKRFPGNDLKLKFVPEKTPLAWIETDPFWRKRCVLRDFEQPLLFVDEEGLNKELRKKNRKEKINRLKRLGALRFERIKDLDLFQSVFDDIIAQYDFRNGARYNKIPSQSDPLRKMFILELFKLNLLHATTLKLNDEIIASSVIAIGNKWLHLWGVTSYAPSYAKYSPSILHYLMLGKLLIEEGFEVIDLTPGDDPYKKELATGKAKAYELRVAGSLTSYAKSAIVNMVWNKLGGTGINRKLLKDLIVKKVYLSKVKGLSVLEPASNSRTKLRYTDTCIVRLKEGIPRAPEGEKLYINNLNDFLCYRPEKGDCSRWEFLEDAMKRFEKGQYSYTIAKDGVLILCFWLASSKNIVTQPNYPQKKILPFENASVLLNIYYHASYRDWLEGYLKILIKEVASLNGANRIYAMANEKNTFLHQNLLAAGFKKYFR